MRSGDIHDVIRALESSREFVRIEQLTNQSDDGSYPAWYQAVLKTANTVCLADGYGIASIMFWMSPDERGTTLTLFATRFPSGLSCEEIPAAVDLLRDIHVLLRSQGVDLAPVRIGQSFIRGERLIIANHPESLLSESR